jgi:hypothetical protein
MKKQLLKIAIGLFLLLMVSNTQSIAQIKIGPVAGLNFNDMTGDVNSDGMLIGFHIGALLNFGIGNAFMIEPQVLYSTRGAKDTTDNLNLDYIEIPIWLRYQLSGGLNFNAGPYFGFLINAKQADTDVKEFYTSTDVGLGFGLGYQMSGGLGIAANYSQSVTNVGEDYTVGGQTFSYDTKNTCIKLTLSYTLGGRRE